MSLKENGNQKIFFKNNHIYFVKKNVQLDDKLSYVSYTQKLLSFIQKIFLEDNIKDISFEKIYHLCYKIVIEKGGEHLKNELTQFFTSLFQQEYNQKVLPFTYNHFSMVKKIIEIFYRLYTKVTLVKKTLLYFENNYLVKNHYGNFDQFVKAIYYQQNIQNNINIIISLILTCIDLNREASPVKEDEKSIGHSLIIFLNEINDSFYTSFLEKEIVKSSEKFYKSILNASLSKEQFEEKIKFIFAIYQREKSMIRNMNLFSSENLLMQTFNQIIICRIFKERAETISIFKNLIQSSNIKVIGTVYELLSVFHGDDFFRIYGEAIKECGKEILSSYVQSSSNKEVSLNSLFSNIFFLLDSVKEINMKINLLLSNSVNKIIYNGISSFLNPLVTQGVLISKLFPEYINIQLIKKYKGTLLNKEIIKPTKIVELFKFFNDKDVFEESYRKYFGFRLLNGLFDEQIEKDILIKLKIESGSNFTRKCEVMLSDIKASSDFLTQHFPSASREFKVSVLTMGNWNIKKEDMISHNDLFINQDKFILFKSYFFKEKFFTFLTEYFSVHQKFHLNTSIYHDLLIGNCEVTAKLNGKFYTIICSPFLSLVCILFNKNPAIGFGLNDLVSVFEFKTKEKIKELLSPLVNCKMFIEDQETYKVNMEFKFKHAKILVKPKLNYDDSKYSNSSRVIQNNRKYIIESNIIRIMKCKHRIGHTNLINEIIAAIKDIFIPDIPLIKNQIESLIEKGYIQREENMYIYVA